MARPSSKIMTIAEKKVAVAGLKEAQKKHKEHVKGVEAQAKDAKAVFDKAVADAHAPMRELEKQLVSVGKARDKAIKEAQKAYDAAVAKNEKAKSAAAKGTEKLAAQLAELEAVEAVKNPAPASIAKEAIAKAAKAPRAPKQQEAGATA